MTLASFLRSAGTLAILGFLTSVATSLVICTRDTTIIAFFGCALLLGSVAFLVFAFWRNDDSKKKWLYIWTAVFGIIGGVIMFFETETMRRKTGTLSLVVIYGISSIAMCTMIGNLWHLVTKYVMADVLETAALKDSDESLLYFAVNMIVGFALGTMSALSKHQTGPTIDGTAISYTIGFWFLHAILMTAVGYVLSKNEGEVTTKYDSVVSGISVGTSYTDLG